MTRLLTKRRAFAAARIAVGLAASVGLGWLAIRGLQWGLVVENLGNVSLGLLALALSVFLFAAWLRALRWHILFVDENLSVARLFIVQHEGLGFSNVMPLRVASEMTQLAVLKIRDGVSGSTALATLGMERVIDVLASTVILAVAFLFVPEMKHFTVFVWGALAFTLLAVALVRFFAWGESLAFVQRFSFLAAFAKAVKDLERQRLRLLGSFLLSVAYWMLVGVTAWTLAVAIGLEISPLTATVVVMGTIFFATAVPAAPSAIGTFEFAIVYVLGFFGIEKADGFGFAVIAHAVFFLPPTIIAAIFLPREGVLAIRGRSAKRGALGAATATKPHSRSPSPHRRGEGAKRGAAVAASLGWGSPERTVPP